MYQNYLIIYNNPVMSENLIILNRSIDALLTIRSSPKFKARNLYIKISKLTKKFYIYMQASSKVR
jgi:hypothetical protein